MGSDDIRGTASYSYLKGLLERYQVQHLVNATPAQFQARIEEFLQLRDYRMEGYRDSDRQRDLSIRFHWQHDHDFGSFSLSGHAKDRPVVLLATFMEVFGALPRVLAGLRVLDIGCWTGGTSLLLAAMGAHVVAIEEVRKYTDSLTYLKEAFAIENLEPLNCSLYDCQGPRFQDAFDIVLFAGVLYHLSDPVVGLRLTFNCLKDEGTCLLETASTESDTPLLVYEGPEVISGGSKEELTRKGWNWFVPSPVAVSHMMRDVGYSQVRLCTSFSGRTFATGRRERHVDMLRAGLSVRDIR